SRSGHRREDDTPWLDRSRPVARSAPCPSAGLRSRYPPQTVVARSGGAECAVVLSLPPIACGRQSRQSVVAHAVDCAMAGTGRVALRASAAMKGPGKPVASAIEVECYLSVG